MFCRKPSKPTKPTFKTKEVSKTFTVREGILKICFKNGASERAIQVFDKILTSNFYVSEGYEGRPVTHPGRADVHMLETYLTLIREELNARNQFVKIENTLLRTEDIQEVLLVIDASKSKEVTVTYLQGEKE